MYGIFTSIWLIFMVNVGKYTIHGCYGICNGAPCFDWMEFWPCFGGLTFKNRGHQRVPGMCICNMYVYIP